MSVKEEGIRGAFQREDEEGEFVREKRGWITTFP